MSLRDAILKKDDLKTEVVPVEEWGVDVPVKELSLRTRTRVMDMHGTGAADEAIVETVIAGALDENGDPLFTRDDAEALAEKSEAAMIKLYKAILKLSGVDIDGKGEGEGEEETEAAKPSDSAPSSTTTAD